MLAMTGVWRWRGNPLCRRTDLAESWAALLTVGVVALGAPATGVIVGSLVRDAMITTVHEQQQHRHLVTATVVRALPQPPLDTDPETSSARDAGRRVIASWKTSTGSLRTGPAGTPRDLTPGDRFRVWIDDHGRLTTRPMDASTAGAHAVLAGAGAAAAATGAIEAARRLIVWDLLRRRYTQWDLAWERAGQDWGRTGAGS